MELKRGRRFAVGVMFQVYVQKLAYMGSCFSLSLFLAVSWELIPFLGAWLRAVKLWMTVETRRFRSRHVAVSYILRIGETA